MNTHLTVCNQNQRIFLLVRVAENEDIENEIKLCGPELKIWMLIVGKELGETGMKVMPLVVTNKESNFTDCKSYLTLREEIENAELYTSWCKQNSVNFDTRPAEYFEENKANGFFTIIVSCMGATKIHDIYATFTAEVEEQINWSLLLLTPEPIDTLHLDEKHVVTDGLYGSGKYIIGHTKANMIANNLPENELLNTSVLEFLFTKKLQARPPTLLKWDVDTGISQLISKNFQNDFFLEHFLLTVSASTFLQEKWKINYSSRV